MAALSVRHVGKVGSFPPGLCVQVVPLLWLSFWFGGRDKNSPYQCRPLRVAAFLVSRAIVRPASS